MSLTPALRTLAATAGLLLALGGPAWAQEPATDEPVAQTEQAPPEAAQDAPEPAVDASEGTTEEGAAPPADASTVEGAPAEPTDAADGADEAGTDASGNTSDDPAPQADPEGDEVAMPDAGRALPIIGAPWPAGIDFQPASSEVARDVQALDGLLLWIITAITLFVMGLLFWVIVRFNERRNPTPAGFTHNSPLEIAWTIVPIVILVFIGAFSLPVLFKEQEIPEADIHIKVTGYQWFWNYEYLDAGVSFDSYMIGYGEGNLNEGISAQLQEAGYSDAEFQLATDQELVLPVGATVVVTVTGGDVIHSWTVPAFGVKQDAVPGRLAQLWFAAEAEGIYFGQCSELCGKDHAYMPITVRVVSPEEYETWLVQAQAEFPSG